MKRKVLISILVLLLLVPAFAAWLTLQPDKYYIYVQMLENGKPIVPGTGRVLLYLADLDSPWPNYYENLGLCYAGKQGRFRFPVKKYSTIGGKQKSYKYYMKAQFKDHVEQIFISPTYILDLTHQPHGTQAKEYRFNYYPKMKRQAKKIDLHIEEQQIPGPVGPKVRFDQIKNAEPMR